MMSAAAPVWTAMKPQSIRTFGAPVKTPVSSRQFARTIPASNSTRRRSIQNGNYDLRCIDARSHPREGLTMRTPNLKVQALRRDRETLSRQRLPYFIGISGQTVGASGLSMHLVVIPPGARAEPHIHLGYETGIYVLEGTVLTRWGANLENETVSQTGDFLFIPPTYRMRRSTLVLRPALA